MKGHIGEATLVLDVTHPNVVSVPSIAAANHSIAVVSKSDNGEVGTNTTGVIKEVGVDAFTQCCIGTDLSDRKILHQTFRIRAFDIKDGKVRQINHANAVAHGQLLGVRDLPKVSIVPLGLSGRNPITILRQQSFFVRRITVRALPACDFHEITT